MCRALRRAGRGVLKGGGSARGPEGRGAGGSSATFEERGVAVDGGGERRGCMNYEPIWFTALSSKCV